MFWLFITLALLFIILTGWLYVLNFFFPLKVKIANLKRSFATLFYRGYDEGTLCIAATSRTQRLQFRKEILSEDDVRLIFIVPNEPWFEPYLVAVERELTRTQHQVSAARLSALSNDRIPVSQTVNFGPDFDSAASFAQRLLTEVFGLDPDSEVEIRFGKLDPREVRIGFSTQPTRAHRL